MNYLFKKKNWIYERTYVSFYAYHSLGISLKLSLTNSSIHQRPARMYSNFGPVEEGEEASSKFTLNISFSEIKRIVCKNVEKI